jgi:hypothetical protein
LTLTSASSSESEITITSDFGFLDGTFRSTGNSGLLFIMRVIGAENEKGIHVKTSIIHSLPHPSRRVAI